MSVLVPIVATFSYILSLIAVIVWPPVTALLLIVTLPFDPTRRIAGRFYRYLPVFWSRVFPFWRIRIEGKWPPGKQAYVVVANHQSFLDVFLLCNIPHEMKWVAKQELFKIPMFGWGLRLAGDLCLERDSTASGMQVMNKAKWYLQNGMSVILFPEGTRSKDGTLLPFKAGAFMMAVELGVPLLPIAVSGTAQGMPKGSPWVRPAHLTARILPPVPTTGLGIRDLRKLRDDVRDSIARTIAQDASGEAAGAVPARS